MILSGGLISIRVTASPFSFSVKEITLFPTYWDKYTCGWDRKFTMQGEELGRIIITDSPSEVSHQSRGLCKGYSRRMRTRRMGIPSPKKKEWKEWVWRLLHWTHKSGAEPLSLEDILRPRTQPRALTASPTFCSHLYWFVLKCQVRSVSKWDTFLITPKQWFWTFILADLFAPLERWRLGNVPCI